MFDVEYNSYDIGTKFNEVNQNNTNFNFFYRARVINANDPKKLGRVQIRIPSLYGTVEGSVNYIPDYLLPWASPATWSNSGNDMGEYNPPTAGELVFVTFEGGNKSYPIYFGGIPTKIGNTKIYKPDQYTLNGKSFEVTTDDYHLDIVNGTEKILFKSLKGATIILDDFDGKEYIKIIDQSGQSITMGNMGDVLPRRGNKLGTSSQSYIEISNNRGEVIKMTEGQVYIDGDETYIASKNVRIPNWDGKGSSGDYYTKDETNNLLQNKSRIFFDEPTVPYQINDLWYNGTSIYKCIVTRNNGTFNINDWTLDSSYTTPDQVSKSLEVLENKIKLEMSATYVTPSYVDDKINYEVVIYSSQGDTFKNGIIETTLTAYVRQGNNDVTSKFTDNQFRWSRTSNDAQEDIVWNRKYLGGLRSITISSSDVVNKATFTCELVDNINTVNYIKSGLIEIFDGYDKPTSTGTWESMIRTNSATIPTSGCTYDENKHGYKFNGTGSSMSLSNNIILSSNKTIEFVTELQSYVETQNILSSNETLNDSISSRIACAISGHLQLKKNGFTINAGDVKVNRKCFVSIRCINNTEIEVYYSGTYVGRYIQSNWTSTGAILNQIGKWCNGIIYSIRVYDRLLTPTEIITNYQEDTKRFG